MNEGPLIHYIGIKSGKRQLRVSSLIFLRDQPHIVLEWLTYPTGERVASIVVPLDSSKLTTPKIPGGEYGYDLEVQIPDTCV